MFRTVYILPALFLVSASIAQAETSTQTKVPGDQGIASVNKNLEKNPDNKGLKNASEHLKQNREKHLEQVKRREEHKEMKAERNEMKGDRHGNMARSERPGRSGK